MASIRWRAGPGAVFALLILCSALPAEAANRYWAGGSSTNWEGANNWASVPKGAGGASIPGASDVAIFNSSGSTARIRSTVNVAGLIIAPIFTGSVVLGTGSLTVGTSGVRVGSGRLVGGSNALAIAGSYTQTGGIVTGLQSNLTVSGSISITKGSSSPFSTFTSTGTITLDGSADQNLTIGSTVTRTLKNLVLQNSGGDTSDDIVVDVSGGLNLSGSLTITLGNLDMATNSQTLVVDGNVSVASAAQATLTAGSAQSIYVGGNWSLGTLATFTPATSTVILKGGSQTLTGSTTFYNLSKTVTSSATLSFGAGSTTTTTNALTLQGASSNLLSLRSTSAGTAWNIVPQQSRTVGYLDVKDSNNTYVTITCTDTCTDSGNNTNWTFATSSASSGGGGSSGGSGGGSRRTAAVQAGHVPNVPSATHSQVTKPATNNSVAPATRAALRRAARLAAQQRMLQRRNARSQRGN